MGKTSGEHTEQESNSKGTGERQGEEREERRGTRGRGAHLAWPGTSKGQAPRGRRDRTRAQRGNETRTHVQCCRACVQGGGYHETGSIAGKEKENTHKHSRRANSTEREGGGGTERSKRSRRGEMGGEKKTKIATQANRRGKSTGAGRRGQEEEPATSQERSTHPHERGREKRPVLGARNDRRMDDDPVGPRRRVAGSPVGYKHGKMGKGDGTGKGVWLGPHNSPGSMGRSGARRKGWEG